MSENILSEFIQALGAEYVIDEVEKLELAATTNYKTTQRIPLILKPADVAQLQQCLRIATKHRLPVYPVSTGKNWGYGSRVPLKDNSILIELNRMNRVLDYDETLAYITVEPGVTFNQAFRFLREQKSELIISTTGGSGDASMIGNALERGIGTGLYADRFGHVCGLEVVLPNGEVINTGFERYGGAQSGKLYRYGVGPYLDGIFSQSNFGIVTKMTIWLMPAPQQFHVAFYKVENEHKLHDVIEALRQMSMQGLVRPAVTIYNDARVISSIIQFPFHQVPPNTVDPDLLMQHIRNASPLGAMIGAWNGEISIRSVSEEHAALQVQLIKERIADLVTDFQVVGISKNQILTTFEKEIQPDAGHTKDAPTMQSFLLGKYLGIPNDSALKQAYWRKRTEAPLQDKDPDRDKCGLVWICPIVPFTGTEVLRSVNIIKNGIKSHGFEPSISLQCLSERSISIIASFGWDREMAGEDEKADVCYTQVNNELHTQGYYSYRNTTLKMLKEPIENDQLAGFTRQLKNAIDPDNILAPGRYVEF